MFVFGSYMNAEINAGVDSGYANIMQTASISGILFDKAANFPYLDQPSPDIIVLLTSIDAKYEASGVLTVDPDKTVAFDGRDLYRKYMLDLIDLPYIDVCEDAFLHNKEVLDTVEGIKKAYPSVRIVPIMFQSDYEKIDSYRLSKRLVSFVKDSGKTVWIVSDFKKIESTHAAINDLRDKMFQRVVKNREISNVDKLAIGNRAGLKTLMYVMHFVGAHDVKLNSSEAIFKVGDAGKNNSSITFLGFGDMMLGRYVRTLMDSNGMSYPFEKIKNELNGIDYIFTNLEGPIKEVKVATQKSISFRFKPDIIWPIKDTGINIVSIANNHALDQGWGGRSDTMKFLKEAGIHYFGHPKNEAEGNAYIGQVGDKTVAFIGFDDTIFKIDGDRAGQIIKELDMIADYVIVSVHWGREYIHQPTERKKWLAHLFIDSGADAVIGHHPHVVQTIEIYNGKPIFYSLGNFIFDQYFSQDTQEGLGVGLIMEDNNITAYLLPYTIINSQPELMFGEAKTQFLEKFISWGEYDEDTKISIRDSKFLLHGN